MKLCIKKLPCDGSVLYDMRSEAARDYGMIGGAAVYDREAVVASAPKAEKIVLYCQNGDKSRAEAEYLRARGVQAFYLDGGYIAWLSAEMKKPFGEEARVKAEESIRKKFRVPLMGRFVKAIKTYELLKPGDKVAVCISGGKDSMLMAKLFQELLRYSDFEFGLEFVVMDPGYNAENRAAIQSNAKRLGVPVRIFESDIFQSVYGVEKSPCYLCARMRRGYLYSFARSLGCNKIALGHHYDDVIETILMGMLYGAQIQTMMPKLRSSNFEGMQLIRPMYLIRESDIKAWRDYNGLHFIQCACRFTENVAESDDSGMPSKRMEVKALIKQLKKKHPDVEKCIFRSVENVNLDTVIAYKKNGVRHVFTEDYDDCPAQSDWFSAEKV